MKCAILRSPFNIELDNITKPKIDSIRNTLIKVLYCGICGSDMSKYKGHKQSYKDLILGHEFCGKVEEGPENLRGKLVSGIPLWYCNNCNNCRDGNYQLCTHHSYMGSTIDGALQEYITIPSQYVFDISKLEDNPILGALIEPLGIAVHCENLLFQKNLTHSKIAIIGGGAIGSLLFNVLTQHLYLNPSQIYIINKDDTRELSDFDYCFECSGTVSGLNSAILKTKVRGTIIQVGIIYPNVLKENPMMFDKFLRKEQIIIGSWNSDFHMDWKIAYDLISDNPDSYMRLIDPNIFSLDKANDAFMYKSKTTTGKVIIQVDKGI